MRLSQGWREALMLFANQGCAYMTVIEANKAPRFGSSASKAQERGLS